MPPITTISGRMCIHPPMLNPLARDKIQSVVKTIAIVDIGFYQYFAQERRSRYTVIGGSFADFATSALARLAEKKSDPVCSRRKSGFEL